MCNTISKKKNEEERLALVLTGPYITFFCKGGQPGGKLSNRLILLLRLFEIVESCSGSLDLHAQALSVLEPYHCSHQNTSYA